MTLCFKNVGMFVYLTPPAHAHVYILEKSQHKVPEEALKVSKKKKWLHVQVTRAS